MTKRVLRLILGGGGGVKYSNIKFNHLKFKFSPLLTLMSLTDSMSGNVIKVNNFINTFTTMTRKLVLTMSIILFSELFKLGQKFKVTVHCAGPLFQLLLRQIIHNAT